MHILILHIQYDGFACFRDNGCYGEMLLLGNICDDVIGNETKERRTEDSKDSTDNPSMHWGRGGNSPWTEYSRPLQDTHMIQSHARIHGKFRASSYSNRHVTDKGRYRVGGGHTQSRLGFKLEAPCCEATVLHAVPPVPPQHGAELRGV